MISVPPGPGRDIVPRGIARWSARFLASLLPLVMADAVSPAEAQDAPMPFDALVARTPPAPDTVVRYGDGPTAFAHLYRPAGGGPHPVLVFVHGGCWRSQYDLAYGGHLARALADDGVAVWSIEYRRLGDLGGGWPGTFHDVSAALDHLRAIAGTERLDLSRVVVAGHSAGGHLALWLAARPALPATSPLRQGTPLPVAGVVGIAAITDLAAYEAATGCGSAVRPLLGDDPGAYAARLEDASPVRRPPRVPVWLVAGGRDAIVPVSQAEALAAARRAAGRVPVRPPVRVTVVPEAGHFDLVAPWRPAFVAVRDAIGALVRPDAAARPGRGH